MVYGFIFFCLFSSHVITTIGSSRLLKSCHPYADLCGGMGSMTSKAVP